MSQFLLDTINRYHIVSARQLDNAAHTFLNSDAASIQEALEKVVKFKQAHKIKHRALLDDRAGPYYYSNLNNACAPGDVSYSHILPNPGRKNVLSSPFGLYVNSARVLGVPDEDSMHVMIAKDIKATRELNDFSRLAVAQGAVSFPQFIERVLIRGHQLELSRDATFKTHIYGLDDYFQSIEGDAWARFFANNRAASELTNIQLRTYVVSNFGALLLESPDLLQPGAIFSKDFVTQVDPRLACLYDIVALCDSFEERAELFLAAMATYQHKNSAVLPADIDLSANL